MHARSLTDAHMYMRLLSRYFATTRSARYASCVHAHMDAAELVHSCVCVCVISIRKKSNRNINK